MSWRRAYPPWIPASAGMTNWGAILREQPIFVPIAHPGWRRHTKVSKLGALVDGRVQVSSVPPHPTPPLAGDKPQRYISLIRFSAVVATRMVVGVAGRCRNPSRIGVRDMLS